MEAAGELANDLGRFLRGEPVRARPVSRGRRAVKWVRRNPMVASLLATVALTWVIATGVAWWLALQAEANAEVARGEKITADQEKAKANNERHRADEEKHQALRQKAKAEEHLVTASLLRSGSLLENNPDGALAILQDRSSSR